MYMGNWASEKHLLLLGFILLAADLLVAYSSMGMVQQNYFGSDSSDSSVTLLVGVLVLVVGTIFLLTGLFSATSGRRRLYY